MVLRCRQIARQCILAFVITTALTAGACGGGSSNPAAPTPPPQTPVTPPTVTPTPPPPFANFQVGASELLFGGQVTQALVTLSSAAPATGTPVTLQSSNPGAATVPLSTSVPSGSLTLLVPILTHRVTAQTTVTVTATAEGMTRSASLSLQPGTFLSFASQRGDPIGQGRSRRYTTTTSGFTANATLGLNGVIIEAWPREIGSSTGWVLSLSAPTGEELRRGTYAGAVRYGVVGNAPGLQFSTQTAPCTVVSGSFNILDIETDWPRVTRLHATFSQSCSSNPPLDGEIFILEP